VSAAAGTHPVIVFNYGSRPVANHEQGREIIFTKSNLNCLEARSAAGFSQEKFANKFSRF
jgi:hypothetical protein